MQTTGTYRRIITYIRDTSTAVNQNPAVLSTDNVAEEFHTRNETGPTYRPITPLSPDFQNMSAFGISTVIFHWFMLFKTIAPSAEPNISVTTI